MMKKVVRFLLIASLFISIKMISANFSQEQLRGNMQLKMNGNGFVIQPILLIHTMIRVLPHCVLLLRFFY